LLDEAAAATLPGERGDRESFLVLDDAYGNIYDPSNYSAVTADLRYTGDHTSVYVYESTPAANLSQIDINSIGDRFDQSDHATDVAAFGGETDIDGNGRVMVLLSPVVNALTTWNNGSYIGGFFNPVDLDVWSSGNGISNHGEIFYAIVPDPTGEFSPVQHPVAETVAGIKSILVHEFQHMINMGQRHIVQGGPSTPQEWIWLNEGLSHLAENLAGYDAQNTARVKLYLHGDIDGGPSLTSLTQGPASLAERGASYLFCRYLLDRWPGVTLGLVGGPAAGPANVAEATGLAFEQIFKDWAAAIYLDDRDLDGEGGPDDLGPAYRFDSHNIRTDFPPTGGGILEPLVIPILSFSDPAFSGSVVPTGMDYLQFVVADGQSPPDGGVAHLRFTGEVSAEMGVMILRVSQ